MAIIYVRTTGNDTTGNGTTLTPYATLVKALTVAVGGDTILMGAGVYAENSGAGVLSLAANYGNYVVICPENSTSGEVIITGVSGSYSMLVAACSFIRFQNIIFRSHSSSVAGVIRFFAANINNLIFDNCKVQVWSSSSATNAGIVSVWTGAAATISGVTFYNLTIDEFGGFPTAGVLLDNQTSSVSDIRFIAPNIKVGSFAMRLMGILKIQLHGGNLFSTATSVAATTLQIGADASTGVNTTGVITDTKIYSQTGHGIVIGGGTSDVHFDRGVVYGGSNSVNGQGFVIKNSTGARVSRVDIHGGALSSLYMKACSGVLVENCNIFNRFSTSSALRLGINTENNSVSSNNTIRRNVFVSNVGAMFNWSNSSGDGGNNLCDENVYINTGTSVYGSVRGNTITNYTELRSAWSGYDQPANDYNSTEGINSVYHTGDRVIPL